MKTNDNLRGSLIIGYKNHTIKITANKLNSERVAVIFEKRENKLFKLRYRQPKLLMKGFSVLYNNDLCIRYAKKYIDSKNDLIKTPIQNEIELTKEEVS